MEHRAKILADSMSPDGVRLTTMEVTFPRIVLAEFNTHRMLSRNSASSRAIPVEKMIKMVQEHPYVPTHWGKNQKGMQADEEVDETTAMLARRAWYTASSAAIAQAMELLELGIHKQITNRLLEPFMWHTVIVTATEWDNFFHLRCHKDAHPEIRRAAEMMWDAMDKSEPTDKVYGEWHLPLIQSDEMKGTYKNMYEHWCKVSVGRCARVSYLTHDGRRDPAEDVALCERLLASGHLSPFEHVAQPLDPDDDMWRVNAGGPSCTFVGNFCGWVQYRKLLPFEHDVLGDRT